MHDESARIIKMVENYKKCRFITKDNRVLIYYIIPRLYVKKGQYAHYKLSSLEMIDYKAYKYFLENKDLTYTKPYRKIIRK